MNETMTRFGQGTMGGGMTGGHAGGSEAQRHTEGPVARGIEEFTAQLPSDVFLWAAGASIVASATAFVIGNKHASTFIGHWAPTFLMLGLYNKIVKVAGSDRVHRS
jgi:hypothetical protein